MPGGQRHRPSGTETSKDRAAAVHWGKLTLTTFSERIKDLNVKHTATPSLGENTDLLQSWVRQKFIRQDTKSKIHKSKIDTWTSSKLITSTP